MQHKQPFVSIIIPTFNRPERLAQCLYALTNLQFSRSLFEVVIVDDGSDLPLDATVAPFRDMLQVSLYRQPNAGPAAARNLGANYARGEVYAFIDDDCTPDQRWLAVLTSCLQKNSTCMAGGHTVNRLPQNFYSSASQLIVDIIYRHKNADPRQAQFFTSNNMALSADAFHRLGGFDPSFRTSEDREFCDRWLHCGLNMVYDQDAIVRHAHRLNFSAFCKQHYRYGKGAFQYHRIRSLRGSGSMAHEITFHLNIYNWLIHPFRQAGQKNILPLAAVLALWQVANTAGFLAEMVRQRRIRGTSLLSDRRVI